MGEYLLLISEQCTLRIIHLFAAIGYSYDAYKSNEKAKEVFARTGTYKSARGGDYNRDRVSPRTMNEIGYEGAYDH